MTHILRAHQLCMEGFSVLFDNHLSTVWSAPNYCYRCGNMASILTVKENGEQLFTDFNAAEENSRDEAMLAGRKTVRILKSYRFSNFHSNIIIKQTG